MSLIQDAYLAAIKSMEGARPKALERFAKFWISESDDPATDVSLTSFVEELSAASPDEPFRRTMHLAIATWDAMPPGAWWEDTSPHTTHRRELVYEMLGLSRDVAELMDSCFPRTGDGSVVISDKFEPWYTPERRQSHEFYWSAYKSHLAAKGWNPDTLGKLDTATTRVVERLSDPTRPQAYQSKGLVVGYVQSGKTANFTGVLAKAIDAGYRLIIVLTGTIDLLRKQTQRRLDMELVGVENIFLGIDPDDVELAKNHDYFEDGDRLEGKFLEHGFQPSDHGLTDIVRLTRHSHDYRSLNAGITALEIQKPLRHKPLFDAENLYSSDARLAVVKKNASVLRRLVRDLKSIRSHLGEIPTLIVDDESDQASVNTSNPDNWQQGQVQRTTINKLISELLSLLPRAQYVGYTATPYANVFIDPSDTEDIFPKDFLLSLEKPDGYMGVVDFHDLDFDPDDEKNIENSNERAFVRDLVAGPGAAADQELLGALDAFVLSGALKLFREGVGDQAFRHHTMLVHESVRTAQHRDLAVRVRDVWSKASYLAPKGLGRLERLFEEDFAAVSRIRGQGLIVPADFGQLAPYIGEALSRMNEDGGNPVIVVNGDRDIQQQNLDFDVRPIWRILVGGAKLSRGFTIEGLTISYYRRRTRQADTLMQMGRWFGFRRGYHDLVRLYIGRAEPFGATTIDLYAAFEAIVRDEEAFRAQLKQYAELVDGKPQITPKDIPPLVSQHLPTITPSARNKMFNAELVIRRSPGQPIEPTAYPKDEKDIVENYYSMLALMQAARNGLRLSFPAEPRRNRTTRPGGSFDALVGTVSAEELLAVMRSLKWLRQSYFLPDLAYLEEISGDQVKDWILVAPQTKGAKYDLEGLSQISVFERKRRRDPFFGGLSDEKHRAPAARIAHARPSWGDPIVDGLAGPGTGAVLLYPVVEESPTSGQLTPGKVVMAFTLTAPIFAQPANGQVVRFRARDSGRPNAPIVTRND